MMLDFLKTYHKAIDLDRDIYNCYFPTGVNRSDFLLFEKQIVCEHKELQKMKVENKVEKISQKGFLSERDLKSALYKRVSEDLSKANKQIKDTKQVFELHDALGLVILENSIPNNFSVLSIIDSADHKLLKGLRNIDCVLCLDFVNTFSDSNSEQPIRLAQVVSRDTERSKRLCSILDGLMEDFCSQLGFPLTKGVELQEGQQLWSTNLQGNYDKYQAKIDSKSAEIDKKDNWLQWLFRYSRDWWWLVFALIILYDWFLN
jgi:hypothetical protein